MSQLFLLVSLSLSAVMTGADMIDSVLLVTQLTIDFGDEVMT